MKSDISLFDTPLQVCLYHRINTCQLSLFSLPTLPICLRLGDLSSFLTVKKDNKEFRSFREISSWKGISYFFPTF